jgi:hypothetical protein
LNSIQTISKWFKHDLPELKKIEIKYGFEGIHKRNNFPYRNISRFEKEFE